MPSPTQRASSFCPSLVSRLSIVSLLPALLLPLATGVVAGCDASEPPQTPVVASGLPRWDARAQQVFDDSIDVAAVGLTLDGAAPRIDARLRERSLVADLVARVRVRTVTLDTRGDTKTYHLSFQVAKPTLAGSSSDGTFEIAIPSTSGAFTVARALDARLQGMTFVGFTKRYAGEDGEAALHWHLSADGPDVTAAVQEAVVLGQIAPSPAR